MNVYEEIEEFLELCKKIIEEGKDPFNLDVKEALERLKGLKDSFDDLDMDSEALWTLTEIIEAQEGWLEKRLGSMLIDPMLVEFRIKGMSREALRALAIRCYHPIATIETFTTARIKEAAGYWRTKEKGKWAFGEESAYEIEPIYLKELYNLDILSREEFEKKMDELKRELSGVKSMDYFDFVKGKNFQETFERAYVLSFLITEGFALLNVDRINEKVEIARAGKKGKKSSSVAIPVW